jgi:hypothetical protein
VLVVRRIHVAMQIEAPETAREAIERTHSFYACAVRCIARCTTRSSSRLLTPSGQTDGVSWHSGEGVTPGRKLEETSRSAMGPEFIFLPRLEA